MYFSIALATTVIGEVCIEECFTEAVILLGNLKELTCKPLSVLQLTPTLTSQQRLRLWRSWTSLVPQILRLAHVRAAGPAD